VGGILSQLATIDTKHGRTAENALYADLNLHRARRIDRGMIYPIGVSTRPGSYMEM
jgi:hypothetical protein